MLADPNEPRLATHAAMFCQRVTRARYTGWQQINLGRVNVLTGLLLQEAIAGEDRVGGVEEDGGRARAAERRGDLLADEAGLAGTEGSGGG